MQETQLETLIDDGLKVTLFSWFGKRFFAKIKRVFCNEEDKTPLFDKKGDLRHYLFRKYGI